MKVLKYAVLPILLLLTGFWGFAAEGDNDTRIKLGGIYSYDKREGKPKIYIEGVQLDMDFLRRNLRYVDFVNDPAVSDVHIIINNRISGSGGQVYSIMYNNKTFETLADFTLTSTTASSDTFEEIREKLTESIGLGLMPFVNQTESASNLSIRYRSKEMENATQIEDPWKNWTFRGDFNGNADLEESRKTFDYRYNFRADKVTEDWKLRNNAMMTIRTREYLSDGEKYRSETNTTYITSSVVNSLSTRWSAGAFASYYNSNYRNTLYSISLKPAVEFNIFPWDVSDRKVFTIAYYIGPEWKKYYEETIFDKLYEGYWEQTLRLDLQLVYTWGEIEAGLDATNMLDDWSKNRLTFDTDLSFRIIRGLSLNFDFRVENIHDQIYLPKGEVSLEDILLNKVQLPSTFEIGAGVGVRVQFGSIYNNIINNRL